MERFVYYKVSIKSDADDILSEIYLSSFHKINSLKDKANFKPWILTIARNKIKNYYAKKANSLELPLDEAVSYKLSYSPFEEIYYEDVETTLRI